MKIQVAFTFTALAALAIGCSGAPEDDAIGEQASAAYPRVGRIWPPGDIPICFEASANAQVRGWVKSAIMGSWAKYSALSFTGWGDCTASSDNAIHIADLDVNPRALKLGTDVRGLVDGVSVSTTWGGCPHSDEYCVTVEAVHEMGHALGFAHEQNRDDTPEECDDAPQGSDGDVYLGAWDEDSVMNYCASGWVNEGVLSSYDKAAVSRLYGSITAVWLSPATRGPDFDYRVTVPGQQNAEYIPTDLDGDGDDDLLVFHSDIGMFRKHYNLDRGLEWEHYEEQFIGVGDPIQGINSTALPGAALLPANLDGYYGNDVLVFRQGDGFLKRWYSPPMRHRTFSGVFSSALAANNALVRGDFDGDGKTDIVSFDPANGSFTRRYANSGTADFTSYAVSYVGGQANAIPGATLVTADLDGDGVTDLLAYRASDGMIRKGFGSRSRATGFQWTAAAYIPFVNGKVLTGDFNGDGADDLIGVDGSNGSYRRCHSRPGERLATFTCNGTNYLGGVVNAYPNVDFHVVDLDGDGVKDIFAHRTTDGLFAKAYNDRGGFPGTLSFQPFRYIGGAPNVWRNTSAVPMKLNGDARTDIMIIRR